MSHPLFMAAIEKITAGSYSFQDVIAAGQALSTAREPALARQIYQVWLGFNREHALAFVVQFNLSTILSQLGEEAAAAEALRAALAQNPDFAPAHINLGSTLERLGRKPEAVEQWKAGLDRMGSITGDAIDYKITLLKQLSRVLSDNLQHDASEVALRQCMDLNPDQRDVAEQYGAVRLAQCKWPIAQAGGKITRKTFVSRFHPLSMAAYADDPMLQLAVSARYVEALTPIETLSLANDRRDAEIPTRRRLRIGYVSSDLRHHAVGYLMAQFFEEHDADAFEVFAYYCGPPADDSISQRTKAAVEHWVDIRGMSDDEAATQIASDGIDILVDVNGHTREARLGVFARRPAPVIVNWLGYPGTMGSHFHHYIVADDWIIPQSMESYYSEKVLRLPCYQPNDTKRQVADKAPTRSEAGLPDDKFVFCSFNAAHKITRFAFERWMEVLKGAPDSVLWLLDYGAGTNDHLRKEAEARGVSGDRLAFAPKIANPHHLARYPLADLFLDTAPYGAHTTASDALFMGVPVLTWSGKCFASRVCGSLTRAAGLPELVTEDADDFVARAIALATEKRGELAALRSRLARNRDTCTLFDMAGLARKLEDLYRHMAAEHRAGRTPKPDLANMAAYLEVGMAVDHDVREMGKLTDYDGFYVQGLQRIDAHRPLIADQRLWTGATPVSTKSSRAA